MKRHLFASLGLLLSAASAAFASPASISLQPTNQTALVGSSASFVVDFSGTPPVQCQWYKSGITLASATNALLSLTNLSVTSAGAYYARVSNAEGTNTSLHARLFVEMTNAVSTPIAMTGWNRDVILENTATPFAQPFDEAINITNYSNWFEAGLGGNPNGLPNSRQFTSAINHPDVVFELQPYDSSNVLWLTEAPLTKLTNTLSLVTPKAYVSISIAAASAYAPSTFSSTPSSSTTPQSGGFLILNFADGSKSTPINYLAFDWYSINELFPLNLMPIAGLGFQYTSDSGGTYNGNENARGYGVGMYQIDVNLLALGYSGKTLASITFVGPRYFLYNREVTAVFAVSGVAADLGINPPILLSSNLTNQNVQKSSDLALSIVDGGTSPVVYQWQLQQPNASGAKTIIIGATNSSILRTNIQNANGIFVEARNGAGIAMTSVEINLYFGNLSANGASYNWGWSFFRQTSVRAQQSTNLADWGILGTYNNSFGFSLNDNKQSAQKFFRIVPQ